MERTGRPATGRSALVTGGSRGIGAACVRALAAGGWRVAFTFFSGRDEAEAVERSVREEEGVAYAVRANLGNEAHLEKVRETVESKLGSLHLFVSNAAGGFLKPGLETEPRELQRALDVNAQAFLQLARWAAERMAENDASALGDLPAPSAVGERGPVMNRGRILAVTSFGSTRYLPDYAGVGASKAALESLVRSLAVELAPRGVTVNAICPGVTETRSLSLFPAAETLRRDARERTPAGRMGTPEDVADLVCLLASPLAHWITGRTLVADGGHSLVLHGLPER